MTHKLLLAIVLGAAAAAGCNRNPEAPPPATGASPVTPAPAGVPGATGTTAPGTPPEGASGVRSEPAPNAAAPAASAVPSGPAAGGDPSRTGVGSGTEVGGLQGPQAGGGAGGPNQPAVSGNTATTPKP